ncbi:MAG: hypothetical protein NUW07_03100 [Candidatus Saccharicenans sp.]|nr:hypothetical protein [Candidatus Saccharicenans sp.]
MATTFLEKQAAVILNSSEPRSARSNLIGGKAGLSVAPISKRKKPASDPVAVGRQGPSSCSCFLNFSPGGHFSPKMVVLNIWTGESPGFSDHNQTEISFM